MLSELNVDYLYGAIIQACYSVAAQRENLNAINIFPVADGDTGDNMAATAMAVIKFSQKKPTILETLQSIADSGIQGARGNSGMIFSQFFNGLVEKVPNKTALIPTDFSEILHAAAVSVRSAILHPVEGTMLTMIEAWAQSVKAYDSEYHCFNALLSHTHREIEAALESTAHTIEVLEQAHVVDAGALGFFHFIEGFTQYLANPKPLSESKEILSGCNNHEHELPSAEAPPTFRYCTEAILSAHHIDKHALGECLEVFGDSVVLTANQRMCRFHLHTNEPWRVFQSIQEQGKIEQPKVDDMLRQFEMLHARKYPIALVVDTCADIPAEILDEHQIHLIPVNIYLDGHHLLDKFCLENEALYASLQSYTTYPATALPSPAMIEAKFRQLSGQYEHVIMLSVAKALSGTHDALATAASAYPNIHVVNTRKVSGGQGLLACFAAKLIAEGKSHTEILQAIDEKISKTNQFVAVEQFDSLIRSGRVHKFAGKLAQFSGIKPILSFNEDGKGIVFDKAFSTPKALNKLIGFVQELQKTSPLEAYCIIHAGAQEKAEAFARLATEKLGQPPAFIACVAAAVGLHAGQGCIALAAMLQ